MRIFVTADLHLGHANIIKYCNRPFDNVIEMTDTIIKRWNERVKSEDLVYIIGDLLFNQSVNKNLINYLNGRIILIEGNHDKHNEVSTIKTKIQSIYLKYNKQNIQLVHRPQDVYTHNNGSIALVGHVHNNWEFKDTFNNCIMINVGVDVNDFYPKTLDEIFKKYYHNIKKNKHIFGEPY